MGFEVWGDGHGKKIRERRGKVYRGSEWVMETFFRSASESGESWDNVAMKANEDRHRVSRKCKDGWIALPKSEWLSRTLTDAVESRCTKKGLKRWPNEITFPS